MRLPSVKTIQDRLNLTPEQAKKIREVIETKGGLITVYPAARKAIDNNPTVRRFEMKLAVINEILDGTGVEHIPCSIDSDDGLAYVNMGDTYQETVMYDRGKMQWYVCSWGAHVEAERKRGRFRE